MKADGGSLGENLHFGRDVAGELAAERSAPTGGDGGYCGVVLEELLELRHGQQGLFKVIEAELEEWGLLSYGGGLFDHLGGCRADDGYAYFADAGAENIERCGGYIRSHGRNRVSYRLPCQDATGGRANGGKIRDI